MRPATCLALLAVGAILAFAVRAHPSFLNLQVAGVVIMVIGVAGFVLPGRGSQWLRRRITVRRGPRGPVVEHVDVDETHYPSYVMLNPEALNAVQPEGPPEDVTEEEAPPFIMNLPADDLPTDRAADTEVVEEYLEE
jgi:hypothetical protein